MKQRKIIMKVGDNKDEKYIYIFPSASPEKMGTMMTIMNNFIKISYYIISVCFALSKVVHSCISDYASLSMLLSFGI